jgi:hypothetical protein
MLLGVSYCRVLSWAQGVMGREYLVGDQLAGQDVGSSAAPQVRLLWCMFTMHSAQALPAYMRGRDILQMFLPVWGVVIAGT